MRALHVHPSNPRWFADASGRAVFLAGSHTWGNLRDMGDGDPPRPLDYDRFLGCLEGFGHNFFRLWAWELPVSGQGSDDTPWRRAPFPWQRTGPGAATDGKPRFDLSKLDPAFFGRVRRRVEAARARGMFVAVMLFDGYGPQFKRTPVDGFPFDGANNVNGISSGGTESQSLADPAVTAVQEAYLRAMVEAVNDLDNVIYEVANEAGAYSRAWQYHMVALVKRIEERMPLQHPVGLTAMYQGGTNADLFDSAADWVSPGGSDGYGWPSDPPPADGKKVVINDTDHSFYYVGLMEHGPDAWREWVWKNFTRGNSVAFMDPYLVEYAGRNRPRGEEPDPYWDPIRASMGHAAALARELDLAAMTPAPGRASTGYCLADEERGSAFVAYAPGREDFTVALAPCRGDLAVRWVDPRTGTAHMAGRVAGGGSRTFSPPFPAGAVLHLWR